MGLAKGFPDLFFPLPRGRYHGLFIEMKVKGGKLSPYQKKWLDYLRDAGYGTAVCFSAKEAIETIERYRTQK